MVLQGTFVSWGAKQRHIMKSYRFLSPQQKVLKKTGESSPNGLGHLVLSQWYLKEPLPSITQMTSECCFENWSMILCILWLLLDSKSAAVSRREETRKAVGRRSGKSLCFPQNLDSCRRFEGESEGLVCQMVWVMLSSTKGPQGPEKKGNSIEKDVILISRRIPCYL